VDEEQEASSVQRCTSSASTRLAREDALISHPHSQSASLGVELCFDLEKYHKSGSRLPLLRDSLSSKPKTTTYTIMGSKPSDKSPKVEKSSKKDKSSKKSKKDDKSSVEKQDKVAKAAAASLLADKKAVNPALSSLFAAQVCMF
jgi:hypothetical protein